MSDYESALETRKTLKKPTKTRRNKNTPKVHRTDSMTSLNTDEESTTQENLLHLTNRCGILLQRILDDQESTISESAHSNIRKIKSNLTKMEKHSNSYLKEIHHVEQREAHLRERLHDQQTILTQISNKIPTQEAIQAAVHCQLLPLIERVAELEKLALPVEPKASQTQPQETIPSKPATQATSSREEEKSPKYKRTIIITQRASNSKRLTGEQIIKELQKHIAPPPNTLMKTVTRKFHVEVVCYSIADKTNMMNTIQNNQDLNKFLTCKTKSTQLEKCILLNVPDNITEDHISNAFLTKAVAVKDEVLFLRKLKSRTPGNSNHIILLPVALAQTIMRQGPLQLGLTNCLLRPHTIVQRCRRCQSLNHTTNKCKNDRHCVNCANQHPEEPNCTEPECCINCQDSNEENKTSYDTSHKASDPNCPTYKAAYSMERERLDAIFKPFFGQVQTHVQDQDQSPPQQTANQVPGNEITTANNRTNQGPLLPTPCSPAPAYFGSFPMPGGSWYPPGNFQYYY